MVAARGGIDYARETDGRTDGRNVGERRASVPSRVAMETAVMRGRVVASRSSGGVRTSGVSIPCGNVDSGTVPNDDDYDETTTTFLARVGGEVVVDFATRDESLEPSTSSSSSSSLSWEVTHAMSGRRLAVDAGGVGRASRALSRTRAAVSDSDSDSFRPGGRSAWTWARGRSGVATACGNAVEVATRDGDGLTAPRRVGVLDDADVRVVALAWTQDDEGLACALSDGRVVVFSVVDDGRVVWERRLLNDGFAEDADAHASAGDDVDASAALTDRRSRLVYVGHSDDSEVDILRHPATVVSTSWRHSSLITLCQDGALRLWLRAYGNYGQLQLTSTIQTPFGGLAPIVAYDWLETSESSDIMYDHALIGLDGSNKVHVWTMSDIVSLQPLSTRRPDVTHRGLMALEATIDPTFSDAIAMRASLKGARNDVSVLLGSHRFGVMVAHVKPDHPDVLECSQRAPLCGHAERVVDICVHPTRHVLASVDVSGAYKLWDVASKDEIADLNVGGRIQGEGVAGVSWEKASSRAESTSSLLVLTRGNSVTRIDVDLDADGVVAVLNRDDGAAHTERESESVNVVVERLCAKAGIETTNAIGVANDEATLAFVDAKGNLSIASFIGGSLAHIENITDVSLGTNVTLRWFDAGGGLHVFAVATGTTVNVYAPSPRLFASKRISWKRVFTADVSEYLEDSSSAISSLEWGVDGRVIYVALGCSILAVGADGFGSCAALAIEHAASAPSYHPDLLIDWLKSGKISRVRKAIRAVLKHFKSEDCDAPCESLSPGEFLDEDEESVPDATTAARAPERRAPEPVAVPEFDMSAFGSFGGGMSSTPAATFSFGSDAPLSSSSISSSMSTPRRTEGDVFSQREAEEIAELLAIHAKNLHLSPSERMELLGVIDALRAIDDAAAGVDEPGRRVSVLWNTRSLRRYGGEGGGSHDVDGQELCWAIQSKRNDELLEDLVGDKSSNASVEWLKVKRLGIPIWLRNVEELRGLVERCAKSEFARTKNADDCALLFIIVDRVKVLAGLYKATQNTRLYEFMCRDFTEQRHREAALKNAYALLSKHRYAFAAAFFVLAGQPLDAASLVWKHEKDLSLTLAIARLCFKDDADDAQTKTHLNKAVTSMLERDVIPVVSDAWLRAALSWLTLNTSSFFTVIKEFVADGDVDAIDLLYFIADNAEPDASAKARALASESTLKSVYALAASGMPLAALERINQSTIDVKERSKLALSALLAKGVSLDAANQGVETFAHPPWNLDEFEMRDALLRRSHVVRVDSEIIESLKVSEEQYTPISQHTKSPSVLPEEVLTVRIPRVPSAQDLSAENSPADKVKRARNAFSKLRSISVKTKGQSGGLDGDDSPITPRTPQSQGDEVSSTRCLRTPVQIATLQNDGFYDLCFNHEVPYELGCASVRQGLSVVNLRQLSDAKNESKLDAWAMLLRAQPPISGFKSSMNSWLHTDEVVSQPNSPTHNGEVRDHEWATHAGLDMTSLTGIIPQSYSDGVGRDRKIIKREPANDVVARSVASHPSRSFFAVGTSSGGVQLWDFHGKNADHAAAVLSIGGKRSTSGTGASTRALAWSPHGARLAACTSDGVVTLWLGDAPDVEPAASRLCGFKGYKTEDVLFLSTNVMAIASSSGSVSSGSAPECVKLWDALQSFDASPGVIRAHAGGCTTIEKFPSLTAPHGVPWPFLITGGYNGEVAAHDLRMLGGDGSSTALWRSSPPQSSPITSIATIHHETSPMIIVGDQDGDLRVYSALDGAARQRVSAAHAATKFLTPRGGGAFASVGVSTVLPIHDGVLTAGGDGLVKCFRLDKSLKSTRRPSL